MEEFWEKFELYVGPLRGTDPVYLKGIFLNGLREEVKAEFKVAPSKDIRKPRPKVVLYL